MGERQGSTEGRCGQGTASFAASDVQLKRVRFMQASTMLAVANAGAWLTAAGHLMRI